MKTEKNHGARGEWAAKKFRKDLSALAALLRRRPMTAKDVARKTGCARGTAYARLIALPYYGYRVAEGIVSTAHGPSATVYFVMGKERQA